MDAEVREIVARLDLLKGRLDDGEQADPTLLYSLEERLAALQLRLTELADERDSAGNSQAGADAADCDDPDIDYEYDDDRMPAESQIYPLDR